MHIVATEILRIRERMFDIYSDHCAKEDETRDQSRNRFGRSHLLLEQIRNALLILSRLNQSLFSTTARLLDRDHYLTAEGGIREGLIDRIITKRPVIGNES